SLFQARRRVAVCAPLLVPRLRRCFTCSERLLKELPADRLGFTVMMRVAHSSGFERSLSCAQPVTGILVGFGVVVAGAAPVTPASVIVFVSLHWFGTLLSKPSLLKSIV